MFVVPKGTIVKLTEGKFPLTDLYKKSFIYEKSFIYKKSFIYHKMGNKQVKLVGFCISCTENELEKYGSPTICVSE